MAEIVFDCDWDDLVPGNLDSIDGIKYCPVEVPASLYGLQQSMSYDVAAVVGLEQGDDALFHGLGDGGGVGWQSDMLSG